MFIFSLDAKTTANTVGIILNIVGVWCVFIYSPINAHEIDGGHGDDFGVKDQAEEKKRTIYRNKMLRYSVVIVIVGSFLQLVSNYIGSPSPESSSKIEQKI